MSRGGLGYAMLSSYDSYNASSTRGHDLADLEYKLLSQDSFKHGPPHEVLRAPELRTGIHYRTAVAQFCDRRAHLPNQ